MQLFEDLPAGRWLVKSIDRFHLEHAASNAPFVDVVLQKLPESNSIPLTAMSHADVSNLIARPNNYAEPLIIKKLAAGFLPSIRVGYVLVDGYATAKLRDTAREITLQRGNIISARKFGDPDVKPSGWHEKVPCYVLNAREYWTTKMQTSRCLVFEVADTQYILPRMAIFQAFYALNSKMINALCLHPWNEGGAAGKLISFASFESGIETKDDVQNNTWKIVLEWGMRLYMAPHIAALWFDRFAHSKTAFLYADANAQNQTVRGAIQRSWYANAELPFDLSKRDITLSVRGFHLRPWSRDSKTKFLITAILSAPALRPDKIIANELRNSGESASSGLREEIDRAYVPPPHSSVAGDPDVTAIHEPDANANEPANVFEEPPIEFSNPPSVDKQKKLSSKIYQEPTIPKPSEPSTTVSAGNPGAVDTARAPADVTQRVRDPSQQFTFLLTALTTLQNADHIDSFKVIGPITIRSLLQTRNGYPCWSLLSPWDRVRGQLPPRAWETISDKGTDLNAKRFARCAMTISIQIKGAQIILLEIEQRPTGEGFRYIVWQPSGALTEQNMPPVLDAIRANQGTFKRASLKEAFEGLCDGKIDSFKHQYDYVSDRDTKKKLSMGLRAKVLLEHLSRVVVQ